MTTVLRWLTWVSFAITAVCLALVAFTLAEQSYYRTAAGRFAAAVRANAAHQPATFDATADRPVAAPQAPGTVATASPSVRAAAPGLLGQLDVPQLRIATAIVEGDDATSLRRGAGHVRGSAMPGQEGNVVLAGHRDTVFRRLGELHRGDRLRLTTARGVFDYRVSRTLRVRPQDTWVLDRSAAALTLVTCYPFDWVGSAPERWVVQAEPLESGTAGFATDR